MKGWRKKEREGREWEDPKKQLLSKGPRVLRLQTIHHRVLL